MTTTPEPWEDFYALFPQLKGNEDIEKRFAGKFRIYLRAFIASREAKAKQEERERIETLVATPSDIRTARPEGPYEDGFDFGYDVKTKEILASLNQPDEPKT